MLVSREVILLSLLLGDTMGVCGGIVQFGGPFVVLVIRSVLVTSRHIYTVLVSLRLMIRLDLLWASLASL
jgi:hypothetical protein